MSATLVPIDTAQSSSTPKARTERIEADAREAFCEFVKLSSFTFSFNEDHAGSATERVFVRYARLRSRLHGHYTSRISQLERTIRHFLSSDSLSNEQREGFIATLYGQGNVKRRNAATLSEVEIRMLDSYRSMDADGRHMVRTLFARLASTSETDGEGVAE
jgi:hypothetical protein